MQVQAISKSGTNQLRGSGFGYYTNQDLRAQSFFAKRNHTPKLPTSHHIDGGTLGGPVVKNKVFYFGAFEGQYRNTAGESIYTVPTAKMRQGDFSEVNRIIYDPITHLPFAQNVIPQAQWDPAARNIWVTGS